MSLTLEIRLFLPPLDPTMAHTTYKEINCFPVLLFFLSYFATRTLNLLLDLFLNLLGSAFNVPFHFLQCRGRAAGFGPLVQEDPGGLDSTDEEQAEVDGGEKNVPGFDDEAPSCPNGAGGHEGQVLRQRQFLGWSEEVRGTGEDDSPFHDRGPEMHGLDPNLAGP